MDIQTENIPEKKQRSFKKFVIAFWVVFVLGVGSMTYLFVGVANNELFGPLPSFEELENPNTYLATEIYSADKHLIGTLFLNENRSMAAYSELSPYLIDALVSTEDERYFEHSGIDGKSLARAVAKAGKAGGGSTITQQLAKMLFTTDVRKNKVERAQQKLKEWVIAVELEKHYTKEEILTMYFNKLDFVNLAAGVKSASKVYFDTKPSDLTIEQAAMFVGMAKNPALFNPVRRPDTTLHRRNVVLGQMLRNNLLSEAEFDSISALPLGLKYHRVSHDAGSATYFRAEVKKQLKKIMKNLKKTDGSSYNIYRDGLKIYTSIDYDMQLYAEKAVKDHLGGELQPAFYKHWKNKTPGLKKFAPFYFEDMTDQQKSEMVEQLIQNGIRQSGRYKKRLESRPELRKRTYHYNRLTYKRNQLQNKVKKLDDERYVFQRDLNLLNRDTTGSSEIYKQKEAARERIEFFEDSIDYYKKQIKKIQPDVDEAYEEYYELWKPFDDSMQVVFNQKIPMSIYTWEGEKDTILSPRDSVIHHKWFLRTGMLSIDPHNGHIKAWVGGIDYKYFQYDHVRGTRQVGSTFKPFVYATAIENGLSPCEEILNEPVTIPAGMYGLEQSWTPKNSAESRLDGEPLTLKMALANSINSVTARIMKNFGPDAVIDVARRLGITTAIDPVPSICLGTPDVSLFEMVSAYSVFANKGIWIQPKFILRIEDRNGAVIWSAKDNRREAMTEENAYKMLELLGGVAAYGPKVKGKATYGTGVRLRSSNRPYGNIPYSVKISGKTGTTQMQSDGWFMGITPDLVTGVWVGCEDRAAHFLSLQLGMGTNMALPIWGYYMNSIYKDPEIKISKGDFEKPKSLEGVEFDCTKIKKNKASNNLGDSEFDVY